MFVKPLRGDLQKYLVRRNLVQKFERQLSVFLTNPQYPSLHTERLEPKDLKIYSFRIDLKYRGIFVFAGLQEIEIVDINDHYR